MTRECDWKLPLTECRLCPRQCRADRTAGEKGVCGAGPNVRAARAALHYWEEPVISGSRGSGTVFFSHCSLRCVYCQNHVISHGGFGRDLGIADLAGVFLRLEGRGAHNINLVTPTHYIPQIAAALRLARERGLAVPIVYNSSGYETVEGLRLLDGLVDVYLPDLKYANDAVASRYSRAPGYFTAATAAIGEMHRQVGDPVFDDDGLVRRGLIVRHLVLPGQIDDTRRILDWIRASLPAGVHVSLMAQYFPAHDACLFPEMDRRLTAREYEQAIEYFFQLGLENGFCQEPSAASAEYVPPFDLEGLR